MPCYATVPLRLRWYYMVYAAHNAPAPTIYDIWYSIYQVDEFPRIVKFQNLPKQVGKQCSQGTLGEGEGGKEQGDLSSDPAANQDIGRNSHGENCQVHQQRPVQNHGQKGACRVEVLPDLRVGGWMMVGGSQELVGACIATANCRSPIPSKELLSNCETGVPLSLSIAIWNKCTVPYNCPENKVSYNATIRSQTWRFCLSFPLWSLPPLLGTFESAPAHRSSTKRMVPGKSADAARISIHGMYCDITRANLLQRSMRQFIPWSTKRSQHVTTTNTI